jgi:hypothetical protein
LFAPYGAGRERRVSASWKIKLKESSMTPSKLALLSTVAVIALGLAAGSANAATQPYQPTGMAKALGSDVEDGAMDPAEAAKPHPGTGMAKALGSDVEDGAATPPPYTGTGMAKALGSDVEDEGEG